MTDTFSVYPGENQIIFCLFPTMFLQSLCLDRPQTLFAIKLSSSYRKKASVENQILNNKEKK